MAENVSKTILQFELDRAKNKEVLNAVDALQKSLKEIGGKAADSTKTIQNLTKATEALKRQGALDDVVKQFSALVKTEKQAVEVAQELRKSLQDVGATKGEIAAAVRSFNQLTMARSGAGGAKPGGGFSLDRAEGLLGRAGASLSGIGLGGAGGVVSGGADALQLILSAKEGLVGLGASAGLLAGGAIAAAPAVIALSKAVEAFDKQTELLTGDLSARVRNLDTFLKATTGTGGERRGAIGDIQQDIAAKTRQRDELKKITDQTFNDLQKKEGDFAARIRLSRNKDYNDAIATIDKLNNEISDLQRTSNAAFQELQSGKTAFLDIGEAAKTAREALTKDTLSRAENARQTALEAAQLKGLSLDAAKQRVDSLKDEQTALQSAIKVLKDSGDTSKEVTDKLKEYEDALKKNTDAQKYLNEQIIPAAENAKKLADALKGINDLASGFDKIGQAAQMAGQELVDRDKRVAATQQKYNDDVERINEQSLQRRTDIQKSYNDKLVDIAKSAADEAKSALEGLQQKQAEMQRDFGREEATEQRKQQFDDMSRRVKAQREETKAYEEHARKLLEIQRSSQLEEQDLLLNRNFLGLFQLQQRRTSETEQANAEFAQQEQDRKAALAQETQDLAAQREFERNERMIAFQQRNADAQVQYQQELAQIQQKQAAALTAARQAYTAELRDLQQKTAQELRLRQTAYDKELQLAALYGARRVQVEQQTQNALLAQANARLSALGAVTNMNIGASVERGNRRAFGGPVSAGVPYAVNDLYPGQRESFGGAMFPPGLGVFIPSRGGSVNAGGGGGANVTINQTISSQNGDPAAIAQMVRTQTTQAIREIFS